MKLKFAFGRRKSTEELIDLRYIDGNVIALRDGAFLRRQGVNRYELIACGEGAEVDLNLSPDPLSVLRGRRPEQLAGIRFLDVSHAYFRGEAEAAGFLELAMASCPKLECLVHQFGLPGDGVQMANARAGLLAKGVDEKFLEKIRSEAMVHEQYLAFSMNFIQRLTGNF